jgi:hypothetical protein
MNNKGLIEAKEQWITDGRSESAKLLWTTSHTFIHIFNCERYVQVILRQFFPELTDEETLQLVSA